MMNRWRHLGVAVMCALLMWRDVASLIKTATFERVSFACDDDKKENSLECAAKCNQDEQCAGYAVGHGDCDLIKCDVQDYCLTHHCHGCYRKKVPVSKAQRPSVVESLVRDGDEHILVSFTASAKMLKYKAENADGLCANDWSADHNRSDLFVDVSGPVNDIYKVNHEPCDYYYVIYGCSVEIHAGDCHGTVHRYSERKSIMQEYGIDTVIHAASQFPVSDTKDLYATLLISGNTVHELTTGEPPTFTYRMTKVIDLEVSHSGGWIEYFNAPLRIQAFEILQYTDDFFAAAVDADDNLWGYRYATRKWQMYCQLKY